MTTETPNTTFNDLKEDNITEIVKYLHPHEKENKRLKKELKIYEELFEKMDAFMKAEYDLDITTSGVKRGAKREGTHFWESMMWIGGYGQVKCKRKNTTKRLKKRSSRWSWNKKNALAQNPSANQEHDDKRYEADMAAEGRITNELLVPFALQVTRCHAFKKKRVEEEIKRHKHQEELWLKQRVKREKKLKILNQKLDEDFIGID